MKDLQDQLEWLAQYQIECVIIDGVAATAYGASYLTHDLDVCYARNPANLERLAEALKNIHARLRGAPEGLLFQLDARTLHQGLNFTFQTDIGSVDLLGEVMGVGRFPEAKSDAQIQQIFGHPFFVLSLPRLIAAKRAAGRVKDQLVLPELEAILESRQRKTQSE